MQTFFNKGYKVEGDFACDSTDYSSSSLTSVASCTGLPCGLVTDDIPINMHWGDCSRFKASGSMSYATLESGQNCAPTCTIATDELTKPIQCHAGILSQPKCGPKAGPKTGGNNNVVVLLAVGAAVVALFLAMRKKG